ncbi:hypothetical protein B484DRAFT_112020 [Ochromonadaceae sp. CCMP2298]|nr:hypothetical protein B484DRAFT_112020 [Ochromonadaceae sp. CCMP2298]
MGRVGGRGGEGRKGRWSKTESKSKIKVYVPPSLPAWMLPHTEEAVPLRKPVLRSGPAGKKLDPFQMCFGRKTRKATTAAESESRRQKDFKTIQGDTDNGETVTLSLSALQAMAPGQESKPNETTPCTGKSPKRKVTIPSPKVVHKLKSIKTIRKQDINSYNSPRSSKCILFLLFLPQVSETPQKQPPRATVGHPRARGG